MLVIHGVREKVIVDTICTYIFLNNTTALSFAGNCARCICRSCILEDVVSLVKSDTNNIIIGVKKVSFFDDMVLGNHEQWQVSGVNGGVGGRLVIARRPSQKEMRSRRLRPRLLIHKKKK